jgi:hypothetical protein
MVAFDYSFHVSTSYPTVFEQWKELNSDYDAIDLYQPLFTYCGCC